jgi:hypothetical protein
LSPETTAAAERSAGSYVLLPPSRSRHGLYTWGCTGREERAYRTDELANATRAEARRSDSDTNTWTIEPDQQRHIEDAIDWLKYDAQIAVQGMGGEGWAFATAAYMESLGLSEEIVMDMMSEHWNPLCGPRGVRMKLDTLGQRLGTDMHTTLRRQESSQGNIVLGARLTYSRLWSDQRLYLETPRRPASVKFLLQQKLLLDGTGSLTVMVLNWSQTQRGSFQAFYPTGGMRSCLVPPARLRLSWPSILGYPPQPVRVIMAQRSGQKYLIQVQSASR